MQISPFRTIITTGQAMKNTYNQLAALQQEKKAQEFQADQVQLRSSSQENRASLVHIEDKISGLNRQIQQIQSSGSAGISDSLTISKTAYSLQRKN
ncbi:hypothetical protein ACFP7A_08270 [Sporolactobacillus kofuensis]|uniref:DUF5082 domain-containing protein n=1 Tax=Sporolactobacillus kofuensis TaxID=269672 RepID=A0ABW1WG79_9BACL|nr:hypothetical protein [Sporolactobacillus kofuensis]MCO7176727.1 hypothetical protein [Sporolactobacillus kofuensis]